VSGNEATYVPRQRSRTRRLEIRGIDYAVHSWGDPDSRLLICLHGWGDCGRSFQFLADELAADGASDWHVVAPDWRGFGESGRASTYWFPDYVADLAALVDRYSPNAPVDLLGHSMGGNVVGLFAGAFPERVRAFVNVEGFGLVESDPADAPRRYRRWIEREREAQAFSSYPDYAALAERIQKRSPAMGAAEARFVAEAWATGRDGEVVLRADPRHRLPNAVLYRRAEAEACWTAVTAPVLLVAGEQSRMLEAGHPHDGRFDFDLPYPNRRRVIVPTAGHMLHFEAPAALAGHVRDFLLENV
jgi:pimeloyl-ACP methyl ester carboxylesterase